MNGRKPVNMKLEMEKFNRAYRKLIISDYPETFDILAKTQIEFAFHVQKNEGGRLTKEQVSDMYKKEVIRPSIECEEIRLEDINNVMKNFRTLNSMLNNIRRIYDFNYMKDRYFREYDTLRMIYKDKDDLKELFKSPPKDIYELAEFHYRWCNESYHDDTILQIYTFIQCLEMHITPFFIHADSYKEYIEAINEENSEHLAELFMREQQRFFEEFSGEPDCINYVNDRFLPHFS